ncbi:MAG: PH domain-containing protein [Candidatus Electryoneaceae bacterium]|nr:PH domain-containing protein [Candidatus Electryoneaceae bacterium]
MIEKKMSEETYRLWFAVLWTTMVCCMLLALLLTLVNWIALILVEAGLLIIAIGLQIYLKAYWRRFHFAYDDRELRIKKGVVWRKQVLIPFSRITNINIIQGPWQRKRKMATLSIETAGASGGSHAASPEASLWSQENFESLRDELLDRIAPAKGMIAGDATSEPDVPVSEDFQGRMIEILSRIEKNTRPDQ